MLFVVCLGPICVPIWGLFPVLILFFQKIKAYIFGEKEAPPVMVKGKDEERKTQGVVTIESEEQYNEILNSSTVPVLVDFTATWCGPCQRIKPFFKKLSGEYNAEFLQVDVDDRDDIAGKAGVSSMPTFHLYFDGKKIGEVIGAKEDGIESLLKQNSAKNK
jgi:thioredoxin 1